MSKDLFTVMQIVGELLDRKELNAADYVLAKAIHDEKEELKKYENEQMESDVLYPIDGLKALEDGLKNIKKDYGDWFYVDDNVRIHTRFLLDMVEQELKKAQRMGGN